MGVYNASLGTTSQKPYSISKGYPTDGRSYYYDETLFKWRPYQNTAEVLFYLNTPESRGGRFLIIVNEGGTLSGSTFTGGVYNAYWFKDGLEDTNLVPFNFNITVNHIGPDASGNIQIDTSGTNGTPYSLPIASNSILGGVKVTGTKGIFINSVTGEISSNIPSLQPRSIPFAANNGTLTEDNGGAYYNGINATFGHQSSAYSGVGLNGNKAGIYAGNVGMLLQLGDTTANDVDLAKSFKFYNGVKEYFRLYTTGTAATPSTYNNFAVFTADVLPSQDLTYSLGSNDLRWLGIHGETIYATTVNTDNLNAGSITTDSLTSNTIITNNLVAGDIQTDSFTANTADISNLNAQNITTNVLNASTANITNLNADSAVITNLTATTANITNLTADTIVTRLLTATTITTNTLNSTTINNSGDINTVNLNATNVTTTNLTAVNIKTGDIITNTLHATDIYTTNLTASLVTTDTVNATTVNTTNLNTANLTTNNITLGGQDLYTIIRNLSYSPYGDRNQIQYVSADNSKEYYTEDVVAVGQFITSDAELTAAKGSFVGFSTIFATWKRFAHGPATLETSPVSPYGLPGIPLETNSWTYDSAANTVRSLSNSNNFIGFVSPQKYARYTHSLTLTAQDGSESFNDNDFIIVVIAYSEDPTTLVTNNAAGQNPVNFNWPIDTASVKIPDQNTLSLVRARTAQQPYNIDQSVRYAIVYNLGKPDQKVFANGESQVWNTENNYDTGKSCDVKVIRQGDIIKTYTTNWNDAPGGKGVLGHELTLDLSSDPLLNKFRGFSSYGYGACSQKDSYFSNVSFSPSINTIYDVRNGDVWTASAAGVYSKDATRSFYVDYGIRRLYYNPVTLNFLYVKPDKSFFIINAPSQTGTGTGTITSISLSMGTTAVNNDLNVSPTSAVTSGAASFTINVPDATAGTRGVVTTGAQSWNGIKTFQTGITTLTNTSGANFFVNGGSSLYSAVLTQEQLQIHGSTNVRSRAMFRGTTLGTLGAGENYGNVIIGATPIAVSSSTTVVHDMLANLAVRELDITQTITTNLKNTANLYVEGESTATVQGKNYAAYIDGDTLINGTLTLNDPFFIAGSANLDLNGLGWASKAPANQTTMASVKAYSDGAHTATSLPTSLLFSTTALNSLVNTERFRITSSGKLTNTLTNGAASAVVDFSNSYSGKGGILLPTVTAAQRTAIGTPADGLLVYQTDGTKGFYYYNTTTSLWILLGSGGNGSITIDSVPTSGSANAVASGGTYDALATKVNLAGHNDLTGGNFGLGQAHDPTYRFYAQSGTSSLMKLNTSGTSGGNLRLESADLPTATTQRIFDVSFGLAGFAATAYLRGAVDYATASTTSTPSKLQFATTPSGAVAPVKRFEIGSSGYLSTATANPAAATAIDFSNSLGGAGGILLPQMTQAQRDALVSVPTSELIYQTDGTPGFYYYNGTAWVLLGGGSGSIVIDANPTSGSTNAVSSGGTYNALATKVNLTGNNSMTNGNLGLGQAYDPSYRLYVQSGSTTIVKFNTSNTLGGIFKLENSTLPTAGNTRIFVNQFGVQGQSTSAYAGAYSDGAFTSGSSLPTYYSIATTAGGSTAVTERFRVGSDGNLYIINTTTPPTANTDLHGLEWYVTGLYPSAAVKAYSDAAFSGTNISSSLSFQTANAGSAFLTERLKISSDGNTYISNDTVPTGANQYLHGLGWRAAQNSTAALIAAFSDGVHSSTSIPTVLSFGTTNAGSVFTSERFRIGSEGSLSNTGGNANPSAAVDFSNSNMFGHRGGLLIPQVTAAIRTAIASPAQGLMVYQTDGAAGFYYYQAGWIYMDPNTTALGDATTSVRGAVNTAAQSFGGVKTFANGLVTGGHLGSTGSAPTVTAGAAISGGAGVTVSVVGTDTKGIISIHTGSTTAAANVVMVNITFAAPFNGSPVFILSPANSTAAIVNSWANCPTTSTAQIVTTDGSLPNNTDIVYHYMVMGS